MWQPASWDLCLKVSMRTNSNVVMKVGIITASIQLAIWVCLFFVASWLHGAADFDHLTWIYTYTIAFFPWILFLRLPIWDVLQLLPTNIGWIGDYVTDCALSVVNWFVNGCLIGYFWKRIDDISVHTLSYAQKRKWYAIAFLSCAALYVAIIMASQWALMGIVDSAYPVENPVVLGVLHVIDFAYKVLTFPSRVFKVVFTVTDFGILSVVLFSFLGVLVFRFCLLQKIINRKSVPGTQGTGKLKI